MKRRRWSADRGGSMARVLTVVLSLAACSATQAGPWDSLLTNSHWYVPQENLLASMSKSTSFTAPPPISLSDPGILPRDARCGEA